ncbi:hypothetical protein C7M84_005785 [Penaeus vannamei]|uniref:Uncharacterized protein n=1 Tax=Penaeus vannamei TaxID=6689 RepID=A0A423TGV1_PENVA|nr:hypothetical protein C7M84_005785 [Penaeus vannamei]
MKYIFHPQRTQSRPTAKSDHRQRRPHGTKGGEESHLLRALLDGAQTAAYGRVLPRQLCIGTGEKVIVRATATDIVTPHRLPSDHRAARRPDAQELGRRLSTRSCVSAWRAQAARVLFQSFCGEN